MATEERQWHQLYNRARHVLGEEEADTLMARVPVTGWTEVATKQDLQALENRLLAVFRAEITAAITSQTKTLRFQVVTLFVAFAGLTLVAR